MICQHCGAETVPDEDGFCLTCSHKAIDLKKLPPVPDRPVVADGASYGKIIEASHWYYEENKEAILADVRTLGRKAACKRWAIAAGTMSGMLNRWEIAAASPKDTHQNADPIKEKPMEKEKPSVQPDSTAEALKRIETKLEALDGAVGEIMQHGYMDDNLKIDIVLAFLNSWQIGRDLAKKLLEVVQALEGI